MSQCSITLVKITGQPWSMRGRTRDFHDVRPHLKFQQGTKGLADEYAGNMRAPNPTTGQGVDGDLPNQTRLGLRPKE